MGWRKSYRVLQVLLQLVESSSKFMHVIFLLKVPVRYLKLESRILKKLGLLTYADFPVSIAVHEVTEI